MTIGEILGVKSQVEKSELELILAHVLDCSRETIIAHPEREISPSELRKYRHLLKRRADGEPFAYVVGEKWFYGRAFKVTKATLIPRPETETLIDVVLASAVPAPATADSPFGLAPRSDSGNIPPLSGAVPSAGQQFCFVDVGTGSGAIAITLAAEMPDSHVIALDVSSSALRIAKQNAKRLGAKVEFAKCDITKAGALKKLPKVGRLAILANLPYLRTGDWKKLDGGIRKFEPKGALLSGKDGLNHYRALMKRLSEIGLKPDFLALEADPPQFPALKKIVQSFNPKYRLEIRKDLHGDDRVMMAFC